MSVIYIGADHNGYELKKVIAEFLRDLDYKVEILGPTDNDSEDDYPDIAIELAEKVIKESTKGILICGSGIGVCISANKVTGIRAASCSSEKHARSAREHTDANILCLSAKFINEELNLEIVKTFFETVFSSEERHIRRINKIKNYERAKLG